MRNEIPGLRRAWILSILCIAMCLAVSCTPLKLQQVSDGLNQTLAALSYPYGFTTVASESGADYRNFGNVTCYTAGANIAVGNQLPVGTAFEIYVRHLLTQGWELERDDMERTRILNRGDKERVSVSSGPANWMMKMNEDFQEAQGDYASFIYLTFYYFLPSREHCLGSSSSRPYLAIGNAVLPALSEQVQAQTD